MRCPRPISSLRRLVLLLALASLSAAALADEGPSADGSAPSEPDSMTPAGSAPSPADGPVCIVGARVHAVVAAPAYATVCMENGTITSVRNAPAPAGAVVVDGRGAVLTPGLIDAQSQLGLLEVNAVPETRDADASTDHEIRAAFRVAPGLNPFSMVVPITRSGGVTSVVSAPGGGLISGQAALWDLGPADATDLVVRESAYLVVPFTGRALREDARSRRLARLDEVFDDARVRAGNPEAFEERRMRDLAAHRLDLIALEEVRVAGTPVLFQAQRVADARALLALAERHGLRPAFTGLADGWRIAPELAEAGAFVMVHPMRNLPAQFDELGAREDAAALLDEAGVPVILTTGTTHNGRNLRFIAGNAVRAGMSAESALRAVTLHPAMLAGVGDTHGAIEVGRVANLVLWSGDPFEFSSRPVAVWVRGEALPLEHRQDALRERHRERGVYD
ncbi:MAG: hypothetical protein EA398_11280 [Deltaproteobacteria bacterium]|nr:MAG: hypothetical protein EA398_11280 [Deltaproteobacteria bacterium]